MTCAPTHPNSATLAVALLAVACAAACEPGGEPAPSARPPLARFEARTHDFGRVEQGTAVRHSFRFRNQGDVDLNIVGTRTAFDCRAALAGNGTVPPGGAGTIEVSFDTAAVHGEQERSVTVYTNDPSQRALMLTLHGEVAVEIAVEPAEVYAGSLPRGAPIERAVSILLGNGGPRLTAVKSSGAVLRVEAMDGTLALAVAPDAPLGEFAEEVLLYSTSPRRPLLRLHVRGTVSPDVVVEPATLFFSAPGEVRQALVTNLRPERPVRITGAEIDGRLGEAEVDVVVEGMRYRLRARLREMPSAEGAAVTLLADHPEQPRIEVPLRAGVPPASRNGDGSRDAAAQ
jgi:hypothetical protein